MKFDIKATSTFSRSPVQIQPELAYKRIEQLELKRPEISTLDQENGHSRDPMKESTPSRIALITNSHETGWYGSQIFDALGHSLEVVTPSDILLLQEAKISIEFNHVIIDAHNTVPMGPNPISLVAELKSQNPSMNIIAGVSAEFCQIRQRAHGLPADIINAIIPIPFTFSNIADLLASIFPTPSSKQRIHPSTSPFELKNQPSSSKRRNGERTTQKSFKDRFIDYLGIEGDQVVETVIRKTIAPPGNALVQLLPGSIFKRLFEAETRCITSALSQNELCRFIQVIRKIHTINKGKRSQLRYLLGLRLSVRKLNTLGCRIIEWTPSLDPGKRRTKNDRSR